MPDTVGKKNYVRFMNEQSSVYFKNTNKFKLSIFDSSIPWKILRIMVPNKLVAVLTGVVNFSDESDF